MSSSRIAMLLSWCADNRIQIDSRLQIIDTQHPLGLGYHEADETSRERGLSVYSRGELIECVCTLVYIPKSAVLSVKSCFFSQHISAVPCGHGAHLSLALALYGELLLGSLSRWFGYLQTLPRETVDISMFWGVTDVIETRPCTCSARGCMNTDDTSAADGYQRRTTLSQCPSCVWFYDNQNAKEWLEVTEADPEQVGMMEEVRQYYFDVVEPTLHAVSTMDKPGDSTADTEPRLYGVSFTGFCHAYSLVSTRAFWVDAYHGLAMVPIADAFNHTNDNHVQMESDYDVCVECGSLAECEHDHEMTNAASVVHPLFSSEIDRLEMRTVRPIPPHSQVFNTYGSLPNAVLLSRYGFMLPENEHDTVRMVLDAPSTVRNLFTYVGLGEDEDAVTGGSLFEWLTNRNTFRDGQGIVDSEATPSLSVSVDIGEPCARCRENKTSRLLRVFTHVAGMWNSDAAWDEEEDGLVFNGEGFVINADGKMSHKLWLLCTLVALFAASFGDVIESLTELKATLISVQGWAERLRDVQDGDGDVEEGGNHGSTRSPPLPHLGRPSDDVAQPRPARGTLTTVTVPSGSINPQITGTIARPLGLGPRGPEITSTSFQATEESSPSSSRTDADHPTGYRPQRDRSRSAERGRPSKRVRRTSDCVVANRESWRVDRLGRATPGCARAGQDREVLDASDGDDATRYVALLLARIVVGLCHERYRPPTLKKEQRGVGVSAAQLGDLLDETPEYMRRTRSALLLAMSERSVVESCAASWGGAMMSFLTSVSPERSGVGESVY